MKDPDRQKMTLYKTKKYRGKLISEIIEHFLNQNRESLFELVKCLYPAEFLEIFSKSKIYKQELFDREDIWIYLYQRDISSNVPGNNDFRALYLGILETLKLSPPHMAIKYASERHYEKLLELLFLEQEVSRNLTLTEELENALEGAAKGNHLDIIQNIIFRYSKSNSISIPIDVSFAIKIAKENKHYDIVKHLAHLL